MNTSDCIVGFGTQRVFDNDAGIFGSLYYTGGTTNTTIPNFSEATLFDVALDSDGDRIPDVDFTDYFVTEAAGVEHLMPEIDRISAMTYGEYTFAGEGNITPYFERFSTTSAKPSRSRTPPVSRTSKASTCRAATRSTPCNPDGH